MARQSPVLQHTHIERLGSTSSTSEDPVPMQLLSLALKNRLYWHEILNPRMLVLTWAAGWRSALSLHPSPASPGHSHCDKLKTIHGCDRKVSFLTWQPGGTLSKSWRSRPRKSEEMRRTSPLDADIWRVCRRLEEFLTLLHLYFSTYFDMDFLKEVKLNFSA